MWLYLCLQLLSIFAEATEISEKLGSGGCDIFKGRTCVKKPPSLVKCNDEDCSSEQLLEFKRFLNCPEYSEGTIDTERTCKADPLTAIGISRSDLFQCVKGQRFLIVGDSLSRQYWSVLWQSIRGDPVMFDVSLGQEVKAVKGREDQRLSIYHYAWRSEGEEDEFMLLGLGRYNGTLHSKWHPPNPSTWMHYKRKKGIKVSEEFNLDYRYGPVSWWKYSPTEARRVKAQYGRDVNIKSRTNLAKKETKFIKDYLKDVVEPVDALFVSPVCYWNLHTKGSFKEDLKGYLCKKNKKTKCALTIYITSCPIRSEAIKHHKNASNWQLAAMKKRNVMMKEWVESFDSKKIQFIDMNKIEATVPGGVMTNWHFDFHTECKVFGDKLGKGQALVETRDDGSCNQNSRDPNKVLWNHIFASRCK